VFVHLIQTQYRRFGTHKIKTELMMQRDMFYSERQRPCFGIRRINIEKWYVLLCVREGKREITHIVTHEIRFDGMKHCMYFL
jgi:hypothetical protein